MHILVDARTTNPTDLIYIMYAKAWGEIWKRYHPHDTLTYAVSTDMGMIEGFPTIHLSTRWSIFGRKKIAHHRHGPDRIISFSPLPPIDTRIPTIVHVFDNASLLYPREIVGVLGRYVGSTWHRSIIRKHQQRIVPHREIGCELIDLWNIKESSISVIPYFIPDRAHSAFTILHPYGIIPGYWIVEGSASEEWSPYQLLRAYARYIHEYHGTKRLIISGDLGMSLRHISECIRGLGIMEYVKITGILPEKEKLALYEYASGWIALGSYYSAGPHIAYALTYALPIFASERAHISEYADITVHPHHTDEFAEKLILFSKITPNIEKVGDERQSQIFGEYTRLLAESTCK